MIYKFQIFHFCMTKHQPEEAIALAEKLGVYFEPADKELEQKILFKWIMRTWLPAGDTLLQMIAIHLPSPVTAQKYRAAMLYTGDKDDIYCKSIAACDPAVSSLTYRIPWLSYLYSLPIHDQVFFKSDYS